MEIEMGVACIIDWQDKKWWQKFGQKPKGKRVYVRLQIIWDDNIKMGLKFGLESFCLEERQVVDAWDNNTEYLGSIKCWEYL